MLAVYFKVWCELYIQFGLIIIYFDSLILTYVSSILLYSGGVKGFIKVCAGFFLSPLAVLILTEGTV